MGCGLLPMPNRWEPLPRPIITRYSRTGPVQPSDYKSFYMQNKERLGGNRNADGG